MKPIQYIKKSDGLLYRFRLIKGRKMRKKTINKAMNQCIL